jgi:peptide deformylase
VNLHIVQAGDPVLRRKAKPLSAKEISSKEIRHLIEQMRETMREAPGVGLAAPQIGLSVQLAVVEDRKEYQKDIPAQSLAERERKPVPFHVIINPKIVSSSADVAEFYEGCLSIQHFSAVVSRAAGVRVECLNEKGKRKTIEAAGWYARILQHEIDHLRGTLYIDRMIARTFSSLENWERFAKGKSIREIRKNLR